MQFFFFNALGPLYSSGVSLTLHLSLTTTPPRLDRSSQQPLHMFLRQKTSLLVQQRMRAPMVVVVIVVVVDVVLVMMVERKED
jgi:hypothetical protein